MNQDSRRFQLVNFTVNTSRFKVRFLNKFLFVVKNESPHQRNRVSHKIKPLLPAWVFAFAHHFFFFFKDCQTKKEYSGEGWDTKYVGRDFFLSPFCFTVGLGFGFNEKGDDIYCQ